MGKPTHAARRWKTKEDQALREAVKPLGADWEAVAKAMWNRRSENALSRRFSSLEAAEEKDEAKKKPDSKKLKKTKKAVASTLAGSFEESDVALSSSSEDEVEFVPAAVKPAKAAPTANPKVKRPLRSSVKVERSTTPEVEPPVLPPSPPPAASSSTSSRAGRGRKTSSAGSSTAIADITVSTASNSKKRKLDAVSTSTPTDDAGNAKARKSEERARKKVRVEKALATLFKSLEVVVEGLKALKEAMLEEEEE